MALPRHRLRYVLGTLAAVGLLALSSTSAQDISGLYRITGGVSSSHVEYHRVTIPPGKEITLADIRGPGKITHFYFTDNTRGHLYRGLVLEAFWDGEQQPSILVPLPDFFGAIEGQTVDYQTPLMQINHYDYMCDLSMPFSKAARLVLVNDGDHEYSQAIAYGIDYEENAEFRNVKSRLHATFRRSNPTPADSLHTLLIARGQGQYVGNYLQVNTKYQGWWGEGDTIFTVDGKKVTHTPGTEDEYGSTWGFGSTYAYAYYGHLLSENGKNRMYRWYISDPVRFTKSLMVQIQNQHLVHEPAPQGHAGSVAEQQPSHDDYISVAFWYQVEPHERLTLQPYSERIAPSSTHLSQSN